MQFSNRPLGYLQQEDTTITSTTTTQQQQLNNIAFVLLKKEGHTRWGLCFHATSRNCVFFCLLHLYRNSRDSRPLFLLPKGSCQQLWIALAKLDCICFPSVVYGSYSTNQIWVTFTSTPTTLTKTLESHKRYRSVFFYFSSFFVCAVAA